MQPDVIRDLIEAGLPESQAHVEGDGAHFAAVVVCPAFVGKTRLQKQQMVYDTVKPQLPATGALTELTSPMLLAHTMLSNLFCTLLFRTSW